MKTTEEYYKQTRNECEHFVLHNVDVTTADKILKKLDVAKSFGIDQISAKFLKDGALVVAIHLANIINLLKKPDTILSKCKIAKLKPLLLKGTETEAKSCRTISVLPLISKVIEKSIQY